MFCQVITAWKIKFWHWNGWKKTSTNSAVIRQGSRYLVKVLEGPVSVYICYRRWAKVILLCSANWRYCNVQLHFLGLFHKAIMESGTPLCRWAVSPPGLARRRALSLSTIAGCPKESNEFVKCLREMPAELLVDLLYNFFVNNTFSFHK